jgi:uncharacterized integral membrane protein
MMRKILAAVVLIPLAILMVMFAVANRASVAISLDPFSSAAPALARSEEHTSELQSL